MKKTYLYIVPALISFSFFSKTIEVSADTTPTTSEVEFPIESAPSTPDQTPETTAITPTPDSDIPPNTTASDTLPSINIPVDTPIPEPSIAPSETPTTELPATDTPSETPTTELPATNTPSENPTTELPATDTSTIETPPSDITAAAIQPSDPTVVPIDSISTPTADPTLTTSETDPSATPIDALEDSTSAEVATIEPETTEVPAAETVTEPVTELVTETITESFPTVDSLIVQEFAMTALLEATTGPSQLINNVNTDQKVITLTISGVSSDAHIDAILQNLATLGVKATFFINGSTSQASLIKIVAAGHEVGNLAYSGVDVTGLTTEQLTAEVTQMESTIQSLTGVSSQPYFRATGGITNASVQETVGSLGYGYTVGWSIDPWDWTGISTSEITSIVTSQLAPGGIILLDAGPNSTGTPAALLDIVSMARTMGYTFTSLDDLLLYEGIYTTPPVPSTPSKLINQVDTSQKVVTLTISGVSNDAHIDTILQNLATLGVKATFFINASTSQTSLSNIVAAGHEVGNLAYSGVDVTGLTTAQLTAEVNMMESTIQSLTGVSSKPYFRATGGITNTSVQETVGSLGYDYTVGWSIDPWDWTGISASEITSIVTSQLAPGGIILLDAGSNSTGTPAALLDIVSIARNLGYTFTTLDDLLSYEGDYSNEEKDFVFPDLVPFTLVDNPMWTRLDVDDVSAPMGVADPFLFYDDGIYHMFFEVIDTEIDSGYVYSSDKIAHAWSTDLINWTYSQVILSEEQQGMRAAYPSVFSYEDSYYMVPDLAGNIASFIATDFPLNWEYNSTLMEGSFVDTNVFNVGGVWYLTTSEYPYNSIGLYYNTSGDWRNDQWVMHPAGLIIEEDDYEKGYRGAGNPFIYDDYVVMPVQITPTDTNIYGERTYWYKLSDLSPTTVTVDNLGLALGATNDGSWTDVAVHHISHAPYGDGYIYLVDGYAYYEEGTGEGEYTIGLFTDNNA